jgi:hypothetical protein
VCKCVTINLTYGHQQAYDPHSRESAESCKVILARFVDGESSCL